MEDTYIVDLDNTMYLCWKGEEVTLFCIADCLKIKDKLDEELKCKICYGFAKGLKCIKLINKKQYIEMWKSINYDLTRYYDADKIEQIEEELHG